MSQGNKKKISEIIKGKLIRKKEENYLTNEILAALRNSPGLAGRQRQAAGTSGWWQPGCGGRVPEDRLVNGEMMGELVNLSDDE